LISFYHFFLFPQTSKISLDILLPFFLASTNFKIFHLSPFLRFFHKTPVILYAPHIVN
jgi:hypothetical protein